MPREFRVVADLRPGRATISWVERTPGSTRPAFRLVRRRFGFPTSATDGLAVFDSDQLFEPPAFAAPWARIDRIVCIAGNATAEDGILLGMLEMFHSGSGGASVTVSTYDAVTQTFDRTTFAEVSRVATAAGPPTPPFMQVQTWTVFEKPGGGAEVERGTVMFLEGAAGGLPNEMHWVPIAGTPGGVSYGERSYEATLFDGRTFSTTVGGAQAPSRQLTIASTTIPEAGVTEWTFTVVDGDLEPGVFYYYRLFGAGGSVLDEPDRGTALATAARGAHDLMYGLLPPVHQVLDVDPTRAANGRDLFRFLAPFGTGVDHFRSLVDGIATRHDLSTARGDFLPHLARMIGWIPDLTVPENTQRQDIRFAPELFAGLGTLRNAPALINRVTGWPCRVKEFVYNVFLTNAPEDVRLWEIWQVTRAGGGGWTVPAPFALTTSMDGAPVTVLVGTTPWLIWHSDRSGRRELWFQRLGLDVEPQRVMDGAPDDGPNLEYNDEAPAAIAEGGDIRLFWTSTRGDSRDIWTRLMESAPDPVRGPADRLTDHPKEDRHPAVVRDGADLWLFWDSDRRGPHDLWHRRRTGVAWSAPERFVKNPPEMDGTHDTFPAAVVSGGNVWLFWCRDVGDRREIWHQVLNSGGAVTPQVSLSTDLASGGRDEAPWPVVVAGRVWLLFHSNRGGPWQIWTRVYDGGWQPPTRLSAEPTADKDPTGYVDGSGDLHVFWTSQRRTRWYRSRTLDFNDADMLAEMRTFNDHAHYVYDTGKGADDWYARDTIGLHPDPDIVDADQIAAEMARATSFLEPFRPAPVRYVWHPEALTLEETLADDTMVHEEWFDDVS